MRSDFAVFILTHGRPDKVKTFKSLQKAGYTGRIVILVDDEDETIGQYRKKFGDLVEVFSKEAISKKFDQADMSTDRRTIVYARNACFEVARRLGVKYFMELDDDYTVFAYKFTREMKYLQRPIKSLDRVLEAMINYYEKVPALSVAMAQGGNYIGGRGGNFAKHITLRRKCMNTFICTPDRPFNFIGRINEDVNTYVNLGSRGYLFFTVNMLVIVQTATQKTKGGMTEVYLDGGTYVKSFYSVMYNPSSVKISMMGGESPKDTPLS